MVKFESKKKLFSEILSKLWSFLSEFNQSNLKTIFLQSFFSNMQSASNMQSEGTGCLAAPWGYETYPAARAIFYSLNEWIRIQVFLDVCSEKVFKKRWLNFTLFYFVNYLIQSEILFLKSLRRVQKSVQKSSTIASFRSIFFQFSFDDLTICRWSLSTSFPEKTKNSSLNGLRENWNPFCQIWRANCCGRRPVCIVFHEDINDFVVY